MDVIDNRTERVFTADYAKKTIIVPKDEQVIGVKGDSRGRAIRFELLKVPDELDLSQCVIEVQYQNALGETGRQKVMHLEESQADGTKRIFFYFRPPLSLTKEAGTVYLQICGTYAYTSGSYYHWHLAPAAVEIADFFDCEETALADPKDDLTIQIQADIASLETQMDEIKDTLNNLTGTGDEVSENMAAEIVAVKNRVTNLESGKLNKSDGITIDQFNLVFKGKGLRESAGADQSRTMSLDACENCRVALIVNELSSATITFTVNWVDPVTNAPAGNPLATEAVSFGQGDVGSGFHSDLRMVVFERISMTSGVVILMTVYDGNTAIKYKCMNLDKNDAYDSIMIRASTGGVAVKWFEG